MGERRFTFFYNIEKPVKANYDEPFCVRMSFIMDTIKNNIEINQTYEVWRGEEPVGTVKIISFIE